ncbi:hypothetical protein [Delftia lacustris]|jgi:mannose/fructose/N-acetylgalactosamine-specific phosphotransferase system component IID|uniref:hypothetical protein n=1 Tax=Delftia TaxID=80865 RepID=UPI00115FF45A|nr:hypothetical protein [Delftia lacustris]
MFDSDIFGPIAMGVLYYSWVHGFRVASEYMDIVHNSSGWKCVLVGVMAGLLPGAIVLCIFLLISSKGNSGFLNFLVLSCIWFYLRAAMLTATKKSSASPTK